MITFDAFDLTGVLPSGPIPKWLVGSVVTDEYILNTSLWSRRIDNDPDGVKMLMAYPDSLAPLLSADQLLKIWMNHKLTYPNFLKSLPRQRQQELLHVFYDTSAKKTDAHRRGQQPELSEVIDRMSDTYREAFMHLLPHGETLEARVLLWLMS